LNHCWNFPHQLCSPCCGAAGGAGAGAAVALGTAAVVCVVVRVTRLLPEAVMTMVLRVVGTAA